jgi:hypothetical protein
MMVSSVWIPAFEVVAKGSKIEARSDLGPENSRTCGACKFSNFAFRNSLIREDDVLPAAAGRGRFKRIGTDRNARR